MKTSGVLITLSMVMLISFCETGKNKSLLQREGIKTEDFQTEGWLNDETFQVRSIGAPNPTARGFVRRRTQSKEAALLSAHKRVIELMLGAQIEGVCGSDSGESTGCAITKEFSGQVKGGSIMKVTYDTDDNCEVVYRIHAGNLKQKAETIVRQISNLKS